MAEFSAIWTTEGSTPAGDQVGGYTQAHWADVMEVLSGGSGNNAVMSTYLNKLEGSVTGANTAEIDTGGAVVDGKVYRNDAPVSVNIPSAIGAGNTRIDRIVLRCDWSAYTVRVHRIAGIDAGSPSAPALTENSGSTYDIPLYQALVNTSGTVTLTDERGLPVAVEDTYVYISVLDYDEDVEVLDGARYWTVPEEFNGGVIVDVEAFIYTPSSSGIPTFQIARGRRASPTSAPTFVDVLSTKLTVDQGEYSSTDATAAAVINTSNDDLQTRDVIRIDVDVAGTGAKGLDIGLVIRQ